MESYPIHDHEPKFNAKKDIVTLFKDIIEKDNKIEIKIIPDLINFTQEKHKIEATLRGKQWSLSGWENEASLVLQKDSE